jgi:hypothetical protein
MFAVPQLEGQWRRRARHAGDFGEAALTYDTERTLDEARAVSLLSAEPETAAVLSGTRKRAPVLPGASLSVCLQRCWLKLSQGFIS